MRKSLLRQLRFLFSATLLLTTCTFTYSAHGINLAQADQDVGNGPRFVFPSAAVLLSDEQLIVVDSAEERLLSVNLTTGNRVILSDEDHGTGPSFIQLGDIAVLDNGLVLVTDLERDAVFSVDPVTGDREVFSGGNIGSGPSVFGRVIVPESKTSFLLVNSFSVYRVDMITRDRELVVFLEPNNGIEIDVAISAALLPDNRLVIADINTSQLVIVDLTSGSLELLANDTTGSGPIIPQPSLVTLLSNGELAVGSSSGSSPPPPARVTRINLDTKQRSFITANDISTGPWLRRVDDIVEKSSGDLVVLDSKTRALFNVDRRTGDRSIIAHSDTYNFVREITIADNEHVYVLDYGLPLSDAIDEVARLLKVSIETGQIVLSELLSEVDGLEITDLESAATTDEGVLYLIASGFIPGEGRPRLVLKYDPMVEEFEMISGPTEDREHEFPFSANIAIKSDREAIVGSGQSLISVDLRTGKREEILTESISKTLNINFIADFIVASESIIYVLDTKQNVDRGFSARAILPEIIEIDLNTATARVISGPSVGSGLMFANPQNMTLSSNNTLLISDTGAGTSSTGRVFEVDLDTGDRVVISNDIVGKGPSFRSLGGIIELSAAEIIVFDNTYLDLMVVERATGKRSLTMN